MSPESPLRICIVGAGVMGCYLGGRLAGSADVTLVGRPGVLDPIREAGLVLEESDGSLVRVPAESLTLSTSPNAVSEADVVLVCTKSGATARATRDIVPFLRPDAVIVGLQNGLHSADTIRDGVDRQLVLAGMVPYNVARLGPATYLRGSSGTLMVHQHPSLASFVRAVRSAGLEVKTTEDMQAVLHGKLLMNLNNAVHALSGVGLREELLDRDFRRCVAACQTEALRVFAAAGVVPHVPLPIQGRLLPWVMRLPTPVFRVTAQATLAVDPRAGSSTADDLDKGRTTEVEDLQGEVVRMARRLGKAAPANQRILELVSDAERDGPSRRRWTGRELFAEVKAARRR